MDNLLIEKLICLADKYETKDFIRNDPSQFLYFYPKEQKIDIEILSFIAAMLSFGKRDQFIPKIYAILRIVESNSMSISEWVSKGAPGFPRGEEKFYRFYSYDDLYVLFCEIANINRDSPDGSFSSFFQKQYKMEYKNELCLDELISKSFQRSKIVPKGKNSANKRIHMFLRWMVRQSSPVDLGLWSWYSQNELIIPLDTHVLAESISLRIINEKEKASKNCAKKITEKMKIVFPGDPCRGDYALFGLGVDKFKM